MQRISRSINVQAAAARMMSTGKHEPPKKIYGPVGRYAMATYSAASKAGLLDKVETELTAINEVVKKSPILANFLSNPTIPRPQKTAQLTALLDEKQFSHVSRNLFLTLSANGKAGDASKVIASYLELMQASRGAVQVTIVSAEALKKKQVETVQAAVMKFVGAGKVVDVKLEVEPSIMGGLQILVGDKFLDLSVQSRVAQLSAALESA